MYVSGKISALRPGTQTVMIFGTTKKIRKLPKTTRFQDLRVFACFCGFLRAFCGFFAGFCGFYPQSFDALQTFLAFVSPNPKTCNQSPKIQDLGVLGKISRYRSNSKNTYIISRIWRVEVYIFVYHVVWQTQKINNPYYHKWIVKTIPILWYWYSFLIGFTTWPYEAYITYLEASNPRGLWWPNAHLRQFEDRIYGWMFRIWMDMVSLSDFLIRFWRWNHFELRILENCPISSLRSNHDSGVFTSQSQIGVSGIQNVPIPDSHWSHFRSF